MILRATRQFLEGLRGQILMSAQRKAIREKNCYSFGDGYPLKQSQLMAEKDEEERSKDLRLIWEELKISTLQDIHRRSEKERPLITAQFYRVRETLIAKINEEILEIHSKNQIIDKQLSKLQLSASLIQTELRDVIRTLQECTSQPEAMPIAELTSKAELIEEMLKMIGSAKSGGTVLRLASTIEAEIKLRVMTSYFREFNHAQDVTNSHPAAHARVWDRIAIRRTQNHSRIDADYRTLAVIFHVASGAIMRAEQQTRALAKRLVFGFSFPLNAIRHQWSLLNSLTLFRNPSIENARKLLNLYQDGFLKRATELGFVKIKTNKMIYIPAEGDFGEGIDLFQQRENTIPVRILYSKELPLINSNSDYIQDAIVHIHGGGFVALSSHTTQNHTRQWANSLQIPIFSIDYRMPPDHPYPQAPYDCLRVYRFLTADIHKHFKFRPRNILISGDSAGGNLTCGLAALILKEQLIKPLGLYLVYPSLDLRVIYYPSRKYILNDPLLWPTMVVLFLKSYVQKYQQTCEPLASPLLLTEEFISGVKDGRFPLNWPRTHITVGMRDPLRDESLLLMQRMVESGIDCKCLLYEHMYHGYLATQKIIKQSTVTINDSIVDLKELFKLGKSQQTRE